MLCSNICYGTLSTSTESFRGSVQSLYVNPGVVPQIGHDRFLPNPFEFIIQQSSHHRRQRFKHLQRFKLHHKDSPVLPVSVIPRVLTIKCVNSRLPQPSKYTLDRRHSVAFPQLIMNITQYYIIIYKNNNFFFIKLSHISTRLDHTSSLMTKLGRNMQQFYKNEIYCFYTSTVVLDCVTYILLTKVYLAVRLSFRNYPLHVFAVTLHFRIRRLYKQSQDTSCSG